MLLTKLVLLLLAECSVKSSFIGIGIGMTTPNIHEYSITTPALISFSKNSKIGNFCPLRGDDLPWIRKPIILNFKKFGGRNLAEDKRLEC